MLWSAWLMTVWVPGHCLGRKPLSEQSREKPPLERRGVRTPKGPSSGCRTKLTECSVAVGSIVSYKPRGVTTAATASRSKVNGRRRVTISALSWTCFIVAESDRSRIGQSELCMLRATTDHVAADSSFERVATNVRISAFSRTNCSIATAALIIAATTATLRLYMLLAVSTVMSE
jgi:hypothetical protein